MKSILKFFLKAFVIPFYVLNAGFFLLLFILMFGVVYPPQLIFTHVSLIKGMIHNYVFTCLVLLLWTFYNLKCITFCTGVIRRKEDTIFINLQAVSAAGQWLLLFINHCILYLPVILYSCLVILIAYREALVYYCAGIVLFHLIMCLLAIIVNYININITWKHRLFNTLFVPSVNLFRGKVRIPLYFLYYTFHSRKIVFFITKITGIFLLNIALGTEKEYFTMRDFSVVLMMVALIHALLVYYYVGLMEQMTSFSRNMPVLRMHRFLLFLITYLLVLLPELLFILVNGSLVIKGYTAFIFYSIAAGQLLLYTSVLYMKSMRMKPYLKIIFCVYLAFSILILSGSYELISLISLVTALIFFYQNFYRYEVEL